MRLPLFAAALFASVAASPAFAAEAAPVAAAPDATPPTASAPAFSLISAALNVADPERELAFYRDFVGMTLAMTRKIDSGTEYILRFGTNPAAAGIILLHSPSLPAITHGTAFSRLVLRVSDIDAMAARLDAAGHAHSPIKGVAHGYRMMLVSDPEGYKLELVQGAQQR